MPRCGKLRCHRIQWEQCRVTAATLCAGAESLRRANQQAPAVHQVNAGCSTGCWCRHFGAMVVSRVASFTVVSSSLDGIWKAVRSLGSSIHCIELPHASGANDAGPCGSDELQIAEALEEMACEAWFWMFWRNLVGFRQAILFSSPKVFP